MELVRYKLERKVLQIRPDQILFIDRLDSIQENDLRLSKSWRSRICEGGMPISDLQVGWADVMYTLQVQILSYPTKHVLLRDRSIGEAFVSLCQCESRRQSSHSRETTSVLLSVLVIVEEDLKDCRHH